jgi:hypothetical protein
MYEEIIKDILKGTGVLIAIALYELWKKRSEAKKEATKKQEDEQKKVVIKNNHAPQFTIDISRDVKHEARKIRDRHQAMRVFVIQFSNGVIAETGLPLLKITFTNEVVLDYGVQVEPISHNFKEVHMPEMFSSPINIVFKTGEFYLKNVDDLDQKDTNQRDYYYWLKTYGVGSVMWLAIHKNGKPAAILVCQWPRPTDLDGTIIARIKDIKRNIEKIYETIKE